MAEKRTATSNDIENVKKALATAGVLKATSKEEEARIHAELSRNGVDTALIDLHIWCNHNYCIIVKSEPTTTTRK
jgi:hypothetical protein